MSKEHIESVNALNEENSDIIAHIFKVINKLVKEEKIADSGYRIINNCGRDGGQTVNHSFPRTWWKNFTYEIDLNCLRF